MHRDWILSFMGEAAPRGPYTGRGSLQPHNHAAALYSSWVQVPGQLVKNILDLRCHIAYKWTCAISGVWGLVSIFLSATKPQNASKALLLVPLQERSGDVGRLCGTGMFLTELYNSLTAQYLPKKLSATQDFASFLHTWYLSWLYFDLKRKAFSLGVSFQDYLLLVSATWCS